MPIGEHSSIRLFQTHYKDNNSLDVMIGIQSSDPTWYMTLTSGLTEAQTKELEDVFKLADQRQAAAGKLKYYTMLKKSI